MSIKDPARHVPSVPSSLLVTKRGEEVIGYLAENGRRTRPEYYVEEFKRQFGRPDPIVLGRDGDVRRYRPEELVSRVLMFLRGAATAQTALEFDRVVLTVPATYEAAKLDLMRAAGREAGFREVRLLEEPVAAMWSRADGQVADGRTLVYDLGGGTFDCALIETSEGEHHVVDKDGIADLGGSDFTAAIERDLLDRGGERLAAALDADTETDPQRRRAALAARYTVREFCETLKRQLSTLEHYEDELALADGIEYDLSREQLTDLISDDIDRTITNCDDLLARNNLAWTAVDQIVLVGGTCRLPIITNRLNSLGPPIQPAEYELAVSHGAITNTHTTPPPAKAKPTKAKPRPEPGTKTKPRPNSKRRPSQGTSPPSLSASQRAWLKERELTVKKGAVPLVAQVMSHPTWDQAKSLGVASGVVQEAARGQPAERLIEFLPCEIMKVALSDGVVVLTTKRVWYRRRDGFFVWTNFETGSIATLRFDQRGKMVRMFFTHTSSDFRLASQSAAEAFLGLLSTAQKQASE